MPRGTRYRNTALVQLLYEQGGDLTYIPFPVIVLPAAAPSPQRQRERLKAIRSLHQFTSRFDRRPRPQEFGQRFSNLTALPTLGKLIWLFGSVPNAFKAANLQPLSRGRIRGVSPLRHARKPEETERAFGTPERRNWMTRQRCIICRKRPSMSCHIDSGGTGRRDDAERTVPMCMNHHDEYDGRKHAGGKLTFLLKYKLTRDDLLAKAKYFEEKWQREKLSIAVEW
jgi:hypothetical protein